MHDDVTGQSVNLPFSDNSYISHMIIFTWKSVEFCNKIVYNMYVIENIEKTQTITSRSVAKGLGETFGCWELLCIVMVKVYVRMWEWMEWVSGWGWVTRKQWLTIATTEPYGWWRLSWSTLLESPSAAVQCTSLQWTNHFKVSLFLRVMGHGVKKRLTCLWSSCQNRYTTSALFLNTT